MDGSAKVLFLQNVIGLISIMERSIYIAEHAIERLAHDVYDDCVGIAKMNDLEKWWAIEKFKEYFRQREKEAENLK